MSALRQYFDTDFNNAVRVHASLPFKGERADVAVFYDFSAFVSFCSVYIPEVAFTFQDLLDFIAKFNPGDTQVQFEHKVTLPVISRFPGRLEFAKDNSFEVRGQFFGETSWVSSSQIRSTGRVYLYLERDISTEDTLALKEVGMAKQLDIQVRSLVHAKERTFEDGPVAFISHDSRDKEEIARKIAIGLQRLMCSVWYDDFTLNVGDKLRESIELGLRKCTKCVLVLSPNFFSNGGWTKVEFDSIFTREILERSNLILPVWCNVSKQDVFSYSPSLLNTLGLDWNRLGCETVCRKLAQAILPND